jgi:hypothetical protein
MLANLLAFVKEQCLIKHTSVNRKEQEPGIPGNLRRKKKIGRTDAKIPLRNRPGFFGIRWGSVKEPGQCRAP